MTRSRTWPCSTWCPERPGPRGEAGPAGPARPGRRWRCGTAGGRPCSAGSHCYAEAAADQGSRAQDHQECSPGKTTSRTAGTDHAAAAAAVVVIVVACTFAVVFSVVVAELAFVVALAAAAEPTFAVVSIAAAAAAVVVEPTFADLSAVVAAVDRSAVDISAVAEAGAVGWSRAAAAGYSWAVSTCSEVGGRSCCSQSWGGPVMWRSEVAGLRSVLTDIVVVVVVVRGRLGVAAEAAEV